MQLEVDMFLYVLRKRVSIALFGSLVGQVGQVVGLELDAVDLVVAPQSVDDFLPLLDGHGVVAFFIGSELAEQFFLAEPFPPLLLGTE